MKRIIGLALCLCILAGGAWASKLPESLSYTIYVQGQPAGKSDIKVSYKGDAIIFSSHTTVNHTDFVMDTRCETTADAATGIVRSFSWEGRKNGATISGDIECQGNLASGTIRHNESVVEDAKDADSEPIYVFEDYILEHEVLLAHAITSSSTGTLSGSLLMPTSLNFTTIGGRVASEQIIESNIKEAVCQKLVAEIQGGSPWAIFYDENRGVPVYMAFPQVGTEVFLDEFFGDEPVSRYTR